MHIIQIYSVSVKLTIGSLRNTKNKKQLPLRTIISIPFIIEKFNICQHPNNMFLTVLKENNLKISPVVLPT